MKHEAIFIESEEALSSYLSRKFSCCFSPHSRVAVKLHMGEPGNRNFIPPSLAALIAQCLAKCHCHPFMFDTPVAYDSPRGNVADYLDCAAAHGYKKENIGFPVVVSNRSVPARGRYMNYKIAADCVEADGVLLLSHVKGHLACGMGGAIKNVGMGCVAKETKGAIHEGGEPVFESPCTRCGACVDSCPTDNIVLDESGPKFGLTWCAGCSNCVSACPEGSIHARIAPFDELLADSATTASSHFKRVFAVNVLRKMSRLCDCIPDAGPILVSDIGFVCAEDMITADIASMELVARFSGRSDPFGEEHGHSPWGHIRAAASFADRKTSVSIKEFGR